MSTWLPTEAIHVGQSGGLPTTRPSHCHFQARRKLIQKNVSTFHTSVGVLEHVCPLLPGVTCVDREDKKQCMPVVLTLLRCHTVRLIE